MASQVVLEVQMLAVVVVIPIIASAVALIGSVHLPI
jgi:hypothetical protein